MSEEQKSPINVLVTDKERQWVVNTQLVIDVAPAEGQPSVHMAHVVQGLIFDKIGASTEPAFQMGPGKYLLSMTLNITSATPKDPAPEE